MRHAQLRAFQAVAIHGGFSRAADRLALTQPAVSDHVRKLEEAYGVQLFNRGRRGAVMTELGRKLFAVTEQMFEAESRAHELLSRGKSLEEGQLAIGADAAVHVLPFIARYRQRYPAIALRLVSGNSAALLDLLESFSIDVAVTAERPASDALVARLLRRDRLVAVGRREAWPRRPGPLRFADVMAMPVILREEGSVTRKLVLEEAQRRRLAPANSVDIESREAAREAVLEGLGVAIMSEGELAADPRLLTVAIADWDQHMEEWLLCLKARAGLHVIRSFLALVPETGQTRGQRSKVRP
ncbi:MAG: LysR family transcriptional regulator [Alphaproteobacteria bacterium]|nr:LysR family transcriptional regulator [Alphaproteobacteria bacterium]